MEKRDFQDSGYRILSVILVNSQFNRQLNIDFSHGEVSSEVDMGVEYNQPNPENIFSVYLNLEFKSLRNSETEVSCTIKMAGVFQKYGEPSLPINDFCQVNGPAIIFPFIREHISSLSFKAGIGQILLPPLNFTKK